MRQAITRIGRIEYGRAGIALAFGGQMTRSCREFDGLAIDFHAVAHCRCGFNDRSRLDRAGHSCVVSVRVFKFTVLRRQKIECLILKAALGEKRSGLADQSRLPARPRRLR